MSQFYFPVMKKKKPEIGQPDKEPLNGLEEIRKRVKKQEIQTIVLKKIIEKTKETKQTR